MGGSRTSRRGSLGPKALLTQPSRSTSAASPYDLGMGTSPSRAELEAAHCWEADDRVAGRPEMTAFRRVLRLHQSRWRESEGHPTGSQPIVPRAGQRSRLVGSRIPFDYARKSGAT